MEELTVRDSCLIPLLCGHCSVIIDRFAGTVSLSIADADVMRKRDRVEQWLEDGTTSFLGIAALRHGFALIDRLQLPNLNMYDVLMSLILLKL